MLKKIKINSPLVLSFVGLSLVALILNYLTEGSSNYYFFSTYNYSLLNPLTYLRMFTYVLGHANVTHYLNNMMYILILGPMLEEKYSSKNLLISMLITALVTAIIHNLFFPRTILLGASGIVFMMIVMSSITNYQDGTIPLTLIIVIILYLGQEVIDAFMAVDNISQLTHIIGGLLGA
ncbi:MAG: rhomboid family intramembrane serine protease, partial [Erysipelotrichaceae bacterium]|nr:rhomboid family intramembrane serine protease [Erysipelotrichaceae bacterium]